ncbi:MAG: HD domain-containing protein, partial [Bdellovibrionales bacterium]|nr:HD domain-containing protein [Bdellovibrionales bacterium]
MATTSFLTQEELKEALGIHPKGLSFSKWLEERLLKKLKTWPHWKDIGAVALGSLARGELCPNSDIDLLLTGSEEPVLKFMQEAQASGVKVRARVPENLKDWRQGVDLSDIVALFEARSLTESAKEMLSDQQKLLSSISIKEKKQMVKELAKERQSRSLRYKSIVHFLEPNLKYGPGGLRDLDQALFLRRILPKSFEGQKKVFQLLEEDRDFLLAVRQWMHLVGNSEVLTASDQFEIAKLMGFEAASDFARQVHLALDRSSFLVDWVFEQIFLTTEAKAYYRTEWAGPAEMLKALKDNMSVSQQWHVRAHLDKTWRSSKPDLKQVGRWLLSSVYPGAKEGFLKALFRSRLMEKWIVDLKRIKGYVQHDHYHRYTLEAHIEQCLLHLNRLYLKPKMMGSLSFLIRDFQSEDWRIMSLTALYHDLGKGLGGDHSTKGAHIVRRDFKKFGFSESLAEEVAWMVQNHLVLSTAAFKRNP